LVVFEGERVQKQPAHIRRIETKYWAVHFKRHCRNSSASCIKQEEMSECMHRWTRWIFQTFSITLPFVFKFQCSYLLTNRTCVGNGLPDFLITLSLRKSS
jgi:hypothetical protein